MKRFVERYRSLREPTRRRLVLENDERAYTLGDTYAIHQQIGVRLIFDRLHYLCRPTPGMTLGEALRLALSTWPEDQTPKIHYSSPRTEMIVVERRDESDRKHRDLREPRPSHHADLIDPFPLIDLLRTMQDERDFDIMLECKAKDLALLRLRKHLAQFAPELLRWHDSVKQTDQRPEASS
jgi:UV DNA damage endonuclease